MKTKYCNAFGTGTRNQPKPLSGIETWPLSADHLPDLFLDPNQPKPLSGIETMPKVEDVETPYSPNQPKPLSIRD
ncbi:hypothetical protein [Microcoleus sp. S13_C5]|uniref:hypothetical protein n=1 Tax=Microcoleus sp. S13_C5 TaxID=3055411 RepID=UPI002FD48A79